MGVTRGCWRGRAFLGGCALGLAGLWFQRFQLRSGEQDAAPSLDAHKALLEEAALIAGGGHHADAAAAVWPRKPVGCFRLCSIVPRLALRAAFRGSVPNDDLATLF